MKRAQTDVVVGIFVLVSFAILMWGSVQIGALRDWVDTEGRRVVVRFRNVAGLDEEAQVLIAGVPIGHVDHLQLEDRVARVVLRIEDPSVRIPFDSVAAIRSRGLLGEKVVEIIPGRSNVLLEGGGVLTRSEEAASIDQLVNRLVGISNDIQQVSTTFRNVLGTAEGEESLREIVTNVRELTGDLRSVVAENEARVDRLVANLESFSDDLAFLTEENRDSILELVSNFRDASRKLSGALDSLQQVAAKVEQGEGTIGKLLTDDHLYSEMDASLAEARAALREVRRAAEEAQEQIPATILTTLIGSLF
jgi:phospholipid/cholesterol/gamma-HCH transport system substrate-binding protein